MCERVRQWESAAYSECVFRRRLTALPAALVVFGAVIYALPAQPDEIDCPSSKGALVLVDTKAHTLALCESGRRVEAFGIRLGKHGTGKTREGDGKTPLGHYPLGSPIPSSTFGLFVPIGYPTTEQRKLGYTGSAVGVHGPRRGLRWLGRWVNALDLTDGCVGIATDAEMQRVADFVTRHNARQIAIR